MAMRQEEQSKANCSEVARLRQSISDEYLAAQRGLYGLAQTARHDFIQARLQGVERHYIELSKLIGEEQAIDTVIEINDTHAEAQRGQPQP
ncbi:hypothetical protein EPA93_08445 [Ktedonosporobacter rubrisoli]|uniref:DUF892 family protein n=1 Tax=Ktedonosporobacter rubrisoli TaxID=2509675 RepID=A0A4P6JLS2_KTERU|nr:hypothetical protein [Ktedonosporobacter rubrisoli]QBD76033.1 hypothetical protein EPA93_08445 [Ktedonosporobacter rubrisoli]